MPNWCETTYKVIGDEGEIKKLSEILESMSNEKKDDVSVSGFGGMWLGELVDRLGSDRKDEPCRGSIDDFHLETQDGGLRLRICMTTAWREQEGVRHAIIRRFPRLEVYYQDAEPGCDNYCTNDSDGKHFKANYYYDSAKTTDEFIDYDSVRRQAMKDYGVELPETYDDFGEVMGALRLFNEEHENDDDVYIDIHEVTRLGYDE